MLLLQVIPILIFAQNQEQHGYDSTMLKIIEDSYTPEERINIKFKVPKKDEPTYSMPLGLTLTKEPDLQISEKAVKYRCTDGEPLKTEYKILVDGSLQFSKNDSGHTLSISFKARRRQVAVLCYVSGGAEEIPELLHKSVKDYLTKDYFSVLSFAGTSALVRKLGHDSINAFSYGRKSVPVEDYFTLAKLTKASLFIFGDVSPFTFEANSEERINGSICLVDIKANKLRTVNPGAIGVRPAPFSGPRSARQEITNQVVTALFDGLW